MHFNFVSPLDYPEYVPQEGDTWTDFEDGQWDETRTVRTGGKLIARRFAEGEWRECDPYAELGDAMRKAALDSISTDAGYAEYLEAAKRLGIRVYARDE